MAALPVSSSPAYNAPVLDYALWYASLGIPVFPLAPRSKVPLIPKNAGGNGVKDATTDPETIRAWWTQNPSANIGAACGYFMDVIDIDGRDGAQAYQQFDDVGRATVVVKTPRGDGYHVWYAPGPDDLLNEVGFAPHLDRRGKGGYVVLPPSYVVNDQYDGWYEWERPLTDATQLPVMSDALLKAIRDAQKSGSSGKGSGRPPEIIPDGKRNSTLFRFACRLRRDNLSLPEILAACSAVNADRCRPPLSEDDVRKLSDSAMRYPSTWALPTIGPDDSPTQGDDGLPIARRLDTIETKEVDWLIYPYFIKGIINIVEADTGTGKTFLCEVLAANLSKGHRLPWFPNEPVPVVRSLILASEDDSECVTAKRYMNIDADKSMIHIIDTPWPFDRAGLDVLERLIKKHDATFIVIDHLRIFAESVTKGDRPVITMTDLMIELANIARRTNTCIVLIRHLVKSVDTSTRRGKDMAGFGGGEILNTSRSAIQITRDPENFNLRVARHFKCNYGPLGPSFAYEITGTRDSPEFYWRGIREDNAPSSKLEEKSESPGAMDQAIRFVRAECTGKSVPYPMLLAKAKESGVTETSLWRATKQIPEWVKISANPRIYGDKYSRWLVQDTGEMPYQNTIEGWE